MKLRIVILINSLNTVIINSIKNFQNLKPGLNKGIAYRL